VSRYQKGKTNLDFSEARDSEWQWHQLGHMQVCASFQTDNHGVVICLPLCFDLSESRFRFVVNPDSDSLANRRSGFEGVFHCDVIELFVHVGDAGVRSFTSGFASESASKPDSLDLQIRIRLRALNARFHRIKPESIFGIRQIEYGL